MKALKHLMAAGGLVLVLLIGGCATSTEPFDYQSDNEIKPGPGLITGEQGAFVIYGEPEKPKSEEKPSEGADSQAPEASAD